MFSLPPNIYFCLLNTYFNLFEQKNDIFNLRVTVSLSCVNINVIKIDIDIPVHIIVLYNSDAVLKYRAAKV